MLVFTGKRMWKKPKNLCPFSYNDRKNGHKRMKYVLLYFLFVGITGIAGKEGRERMSVNVRNGHSFVK